MFADRTTPAGRAARFRVGLIASLVLAALCAIVLFGGSAQGAKTLEQNRAELQQVDKQSSAISGSLDDMNREADSLIGQLSKLRIQEAALQRELSAKQAELDKTTAELRAEEKHLARVRAQLERALDVLRRWLVAVYKSDNPDVTSIALQSASWSDLIAQNEYLDKIQNYDKTIAERIHGLRDQVAAAVAQLDKARARLEAARNKIAADKAKVTSTRSAVESRHNQLEALQVVRQKKLRALLGQKANLEHDIMAAETPGPLTAARPPAPGERATMISPSQAVAPKKAPAAVKGAIAAANSIATRPYVWGGGHGSFESSGYDCSGAVSFALHGAGMLTSPRDSGGLAVWGVEGAGQWITVYANGGHAFMVIAGLRFDTSQTGGNGPRWSNQMVAPGGYSVRHYPGY
jgi:septal ring factor EnvC (AmiA/AmiB activator)